jgi:transcriptional regulator with XRE-family HTH domain
MNHTELLIEARKYTEYNYSLLAARLGITRQYINKMKQSGRVPEPYWSKIEEITGGKVKASKFRRAAKKAPQIDSKSAKT